MLMSYSSTDPGLNLLSYNGHGIYTLEELDDFAIVVKPAYMFLLHLTINRHFQDLCELVEAVHSVFDFWLPLKLGYHLKTT